MDGTFVLISTGHMPIDFHQKIKYNCFNRKINKNPSPFGEGTKIYTIRRRGWVPAQRSVKLSDLYGSRSVEQTDGIERDFTPWCRLHLSG